MSVAVYLPFFKILEKQELARELEEAEKGKAEVFDASEQELLDELDLDF